MAYICRLAQFCFWQDGYWDRMNAVRGATKNFEAPQKRSAATCA